MYCYYKKKKVFLESECGCYSPWHPGSGPHSLVSEQGDGSAGIMLSQEYSDTYSLVSEQGDIPASIVLS